MIPQIMGIVNATPDSFHAPSRVADGRPLVAAVNHCLELVRDGADLLDLGGESTRPGSAYVEPEEELRRVIPLLDALQGQVSVPLSIDTRRRSVAQEAHRRGVTWLNDISALEDDPSLADFAAETGMTVVLMHKQGTPQTMQKAPQYADVYTQVRNYLRSRIDFALSRNISLSRIVADPGIGFGKDLDHNLQLLHRLDELGTDLGVPILLGASRKRFVGDLTGATVEQRLPGSLATALWAAQKQVRWVRVHDVAPTAQALQVWKALQQGAR